EGGQLELNAVEPVNAFNTRDSTRILTPATNTLADRCIAWMNVQEVVLEDNLRCLTRVHTALVAVLGVAPAADVSATVLEARRAVASPPPRHPGPEPRLTRHPPPSCRA